MQNKGRIEALAIAIFLVAGVVVWRVIVGMHPIPPMEDAVDGARTRVEIAFDYVRQSGTASNQFAVWIADAEGKIVKTLVATGFTSGRGGWKSRKEALPQWVADSGIATMKDAQIDAFARATPQSGAVRSVWYCDDAEGARVPGGSYSVNVEATLRGENRVLYRSAVRLYGENAESRPEPTFFGPGTAERGMLTNVVVRFVP